MGCFVVVYWGGDDRFFFFFFLGVYSSGCVFCLMVVVGFVLMVVARFFV